MLVLFVTGLVNVQAAATVIFLQWTYTQALYGRAAIRYYPTIATLNSVPRAQRMLSASPWQVQFIAAAENNRLRVVYQSS